ncbi:IS66 family transposase [Sulfobacillus thermosulfidooxidans]|uniref:IS66 family transposase n=1 Tax=Sulfobacillus thermosulfidooxidans TaxID=28034 RepID=UPI00031A7CDF
MPLSRQTLANWVIYAAHTWLKPVHRTLKHTLVQQDIVQADETTLTVLHETGRRAEQKILHVALSNGARGAPDCALRVSAGTAGSLCATISDGISGLLAM